MTLTRLGKYEIVAKIGQGGMGEVYRAHDPVLGRDVAIKTMISEPGSEQEDLRQRFRREARSAGGLNHPNIVTVHDFGEEQGRMYIAMELLEGTDLKDVILGPPLSVEAQLNIMEQICDGLAFAHARDVIHRDLKPANIHVSPTRQVKIMDFGLARVSSSNVTRAGMILGTPNYMAPEQVKAEKVTARSDVFSLGAVFYELLSGRKPFDAESLAGVLYQVMQTQPEPLDQVRREAPRALCAVVHRAMEKNPARRYADAAELREALREARRAMGPVTMAGISPPVSSPSDPVTLSPPTLTRPTPPTPSSHPRDALARVGPETVQARPLEETRAAPAAGPPTAAEPPTLRPSGSPQPPTVAVRDVRPTPPPTQRRSTTTSGRGEARPRPVAGGRTVSVAVLVAVGLGIAAFVWQQVKRPPATGGTASPPSVASPPPTTTAPAPPIVEMARRALDDRDYRRAASLAEDALGADSGSASARTTLDQARRALREGEQAAARVRKGIEGRDSQAASRALTALIALDPRHPEVPALTTALNELLSAQTEELRSAAERARAATPPPARQPQATAPPATLAPVITLPAPRQAVATPPPATPPPPTQPPAPSAETAILQALSQYREACRRLDLVAIRHLFPLIKDDALKVFGKMERYEVTFEDPQVKLEGERFATVTCLAIYEATPKNSSRVASRSQMRQTIRLEKVDNAWVIRSIE